MSLLLCRPPILRPRSYQSVATFVFPPIWRPRSYQSISIHCFFHATRSLEVTKVSLLSCFLPVLRPRCSQSLTIYRLSLRSRPRSYQSAPSKLPKCRCLRVPLPSCALEVNKVLVFIVFYATRSYQSGATCVLPSSLAPSKLPMCRAPSKLPKCRYLRVPPHLSPSKLPKYYYPSFFLSLIHI